MEATTLTKTKIQTLVKRRLADTFTPVSIYLKVRDKYKEAVLLESTDFRSRENCFSFVGVLPVATFSAQGAQLKYAFPDGSKQEIVLENLQTLPQLFNEFVQSFDVEAHPPVMNGFLGHSSFEAVAYFDSLHFDAAKRKTDLPDFHYSLYRFMIAINHFNDELTILENIPEGETSQMEALETVLNSQSFGVYHFHRQGAETSNMTDEAFRNLVAVGKRHCKIGDVFQIVLSRRFSQPFTGDDFNVYRVLRSVNPSPYLFYFDYGNYKIFGSSPEDQLLIKNRVAQINPIAGTYRRTGNDEQDAQNALALTADPKENSEHIMLVDLARNDLGRHAHSVQVKQLKEIQYYSHVIHLVSKVQGQLNDDADSIEVFADTFPAGTLSGAPKYKAIKLIKEYEQENRHFYGGAIGYIGFNGDITHAIVIRSFLSKDNVLHCQAGAGIVESSVEEKELQEVNHKLGALKKALAGAEGLAL